METTRVRYEKEKTMTLRKQITLINIIFITLLLSLVMTINYFESKKFVEDELYASTINNLSTISQKLSETQGDRAEIESIIDSVFDSGDYKSIRFSSDDDNWTYAQEYKNNLDNIPNWFVNIAHIEPQLLSKELSSGWNIFGKIQLEADLKRSYTTLYEIFKYLIYLLIIFSILTIITIHFILKTVLKPLINIEKQAIAIMHNEFTIQKDIPKTIEFRDVVLAMNSMVKKVKFVFENTSKELAEIKRQEYIDSVSKLRTRTYLLNKLPEYLKLDAERVEGINVLISLNGAAEANMVLGREEMDRLYLKFATLFRSATKEFDHAIIARINGTEFDIFIPNCSIDEIPDKIEWIKDESISIIKGYDLDLDIIYLSFGICEYEHTQNITELLSIADNTLQKAKISPLHVYYQKLNKKIESKGKEQWRILINHSIEKRAFSFTSYDVMDTKTNKLVQSTLSIAMHEGDKSYSYDEFMPIAIELGLSSKIYDLALSLLAMDKSIKFSSHNNTLRIPSDYLNLKSSYETLKRICIEYSSQEKHTLTLEITDKYIRKNIIFLEIYNEMFKKHNIPMGIFEFIAEGENYEYIQDIHPDYIKIDANILLSQTFQELRPLKVLAETLGISIIATGVKDETIAKSLKDIDIYIMESNYIKSDTHF